MLATSVRLAAALGLLISAASADADGLRLEAGDPAAMSLTFAGAGGATQTLSFDPPVVKEAVMTGDRVVAPMNYDEDGRGWDGWGMDHPPISLQPELDTLMLGHLDRQVRPDSVAVSSIDNRRHFERGRDYLVHPTRGMVINHNDGLGKPGSTPLRITFAYATQRIDLVQLDATGRASVKAGDPVAVCPMIPEPDPGHTAFAGVYIAPDKVARGEPPTITVEYIHLIEDVARAAPINPAALRRTRAALAAGDDVAIAFLGDSITLGAEAGRWWEDRSQTYTGRVIAGLGERYPEASIMEIPAYRGAINARSAGALFVDQVKPADPDLLVIALGVNDAAGRRAPRNPPESFKRDLRAVIEPAQEAGMEVLLVTPLVPANEAGPRIDAYRQAMIDLAQEMDVACADVQTDWRNLSARGIPPATQLHNAVNHPGSFGMTVYADAILRFFDEQPAADAP